MWTVAILIGLGAAAAVGDDKVAVAPKEAYPVGVTPKTAPPQEARALSNSFATTAKALRPSVVRIDVERKQLVRPISDSQSPELPHFLRRHFGFGFPSPGFPDDRGSGTGSGLVLDVAGNIATNSHVIDGASQVMVTLEGGEQIAAKVVGRDRRTDIAVVRLERVPDGLVAARLGNSDELEVGEWVLAIGSPLGLDQTVTAGIVSGKGRSARQAPVLGERVRSYISTDAKINPGNSGGPLVNLEAEVVGINTLINTGPGGAYGFAIPVNEVVRVVRTLISDGRVRYPYLGVRVAGVGELRGPEKQMLGANAPSKGVFVSEVTAGSPAEAAGLKGGDVIVKIDGQPLERGSDLVALVSEKPIGGQIALDLLREGRVQSIRVTLGELPSDDTEDEELRTVGVALQTLTPELARSLGVSPAMKGVVIAGVVPDSPASQAGLGSGDLIIEIDRQPVTSAEQAAAILKKPRPNGHLLRIRGENGTRFVSVKTP